MAKKTDIWMPIYIGDYLGDTQHLTPEKHGIYLLLMFHYWKQGPLENDLEELSCVARTTEEKVLKILEGFFSLEDGYWRHGRIDKERAAAKAKSEVAREKANKRWGNNDSCTDDAAAYAGADTEEDTEADATAENQHDGQHGKSMPNGCSSPSPSDSSYKPPHTPHGGGRFKPNLDFIEDGNLRRIYSEWCQGKGKPFRKQIGVEKGYAHLLALSGGDPQIAQMIVDQSLANNWQGLFELKDVDPRERRSGKSATGPAEDNFRQLSQEEEQEADEYLEAGGIMGEVSRRREVAHA